MYIVYAELNWEKYQRENQFVNISARPYVIEFFQKKQKKLEWKFVVVHFDENLESKCWMHFKKYIYKDNNQYEIVWQSKRNICLDCEQIDRNVWEREKCYRWKETDLKSTAQSARENQQTRQL